jgi:hypothetical protein
VDEIGKELRRKSLRGGRRSRNVPERMMPRSDSSRRSPAGDIHPFRSIPHVEETMMNSTARRRARQGVAVALVCAAASAGLAACRPLGQPAQSTAVKPRSLCVRHEPVAYGFVDGELTQTYLRCHAQPACRQFAQTETKQIAGYSAQIPQWLWSNNSDNHAFSVAQQDGFIAAAKQLAVTHAPPGKVISGISFFRDMVPSTTTPGYFLGANITYAQCGNVPHQ